MVLPLGLRAWSVVAILQGALAATDIGQALRGAASVSKQPVPTASEDFRSLLGEGAELNVDQLFEEYSNFHLGDDSEGTLEADDSSEQFEADESEDDFADDSDRQLKANDTNFDDAESDENDTLDGRRLIDENITLDDDEAEDSDSDAASATSLVASSADTSYSKPSYCSRNPHSEGCWIYRKCVGHGRQFCVVSGYMIVPGWDCPGSESINGGNALFYDGLMDAARRQCSDSHCVLITNPVGHRTQYQFHIHYRHYNDGGASLKSQLEHKLCDSVGWHFFWQCGAAKARLYPYFPRVFSDVAAVYGGGSLANVGISVWQTDACGGGRKYIVLATTHCSIEHSISSR